MKRQPGTNSPATVAIASAIGCTIEWYDFFLYGVLASLVFNKLFFPTFDPVVGTLIAYVTFAVGFVARPIGGLIFGHFGDRVGRKRMLILTLVIMGVATFMIGLLPTYSNIGIWAAVLLLVLRLAQGIGIGGEWGGAILMSFEYAPKGSRGLFGSLPQIGLAAGLALSTGVVALLLRLPQDQFLAWGWRLGFLVSAALVIVGIYIRSKIAETPAFQDVIETGGVARVPFAKLVRTSWKQILLGMGARYGEGVTFNTYAVFAISYLSTTLKIPKTTALLAVTISSLVMVIFIPICGKLSDRFGRRMVYGSGAFLIGVAGFVAFGAINASRETYVIWLAIVIPLGVLYPLMYGPEPALFAELFHPSVRYSGVSFVYQFSGIFASGLTPIVLTWLAYIGHGQPWMIAGYAAFACGVSLVSTLLMRETAHLELGNAYDIVPGRAGGPAY